MNKTVLLILTVAIASLTGGCSFFTSFRESRKDLDEQTNQSLPQTEASQSQTETTAETTETEAELADSAEKSEPSQTVAGLVPATNPDTRVRNSIRGRQDPFSVVTLVPKIEIEAEEEETKPTPQPRVTNRNNRERLVVNQNRNNRTSNNSNTTDKLKTKLAQDVIISGLYESRNGTKLIVQAPEESNSRYVEVGQYLSNGQILVKRIDRNHFPTPLVVLEQSGVEVTKTIGEEPGDSKKITSLPPAAYPNQELVSRLTWDLESF